MLKQITEFKNPFVDNAFILPDEVVIYIPSTLQANESTDNSQYVDYIAAELSKLNGGATITSGVGCWVSTEGLGLIKESVTLVSSSCDDLTPKLESIFKLALWVKNEMTQEAVSVKINGQLFIV